MTAIKNFKELSRQNTDGLMSVSRDGEKNFSALIHVGEFLDALLTIDEGHYEEFDDFAAREGMSDKCWSEIIADYAAHIGYEIIDRDDTYNYETDLDQDYKYTIITPVGESYWQFSTNTIIFIQTRDALGGLSSPVPARRRGNSVYDLLDLNVGWTFVEGIDEDGTVLDGDDLQYLGEYCQVGSTGRFKEKIDEVLEINADKGRVKARLKTGEVVTAMPTCSALLI